MRALTIFVSGLLIVGAVAGYVFVSSHARPKIEFIPMEDVDPQLVKIIAHETAKIMHVSYTICERITIPRSTYDADTRKCDVKELLKVVPAGYNASDPHRLAILGYDLNHPGMNTCISLANIETKRAVLSIALLHPEVWHGQAPNQDLMLRRAIVESAHILGDTYGLTICHNAGCIEGPAETYRDIDSKRLDFCPSCRKKLEAAIQQQQNGDE